MSTQPAEEAPDAFVDEVVVLLRDEATASFRDEADADGIVRENARLRARVAELEAEVARLREERALLFQFHRNREIQPGEHAVLLAVLNTYESAASRGDVDPRGFAKAYLGNRKKGDTAPRGDDTSLAALAGVSPDTVSRTLADAAAWGVIETTRSLEPVEVPNEDGVLVTAWRERLLYKPVRRGREGLAFLATLTPPRATGDDGKPRTWGGDRRKAPRCPDHPRAGVRVRQHYHCDAPGCDRDLGPVAGDGEGHPHLAEPYHVDVSSAPHLAEPCNGHVSLRPQDADGQAELAPANGHAPGDLAAARAKLKGNGHATARDATSSPNGRGPSPHDDSDFEEGVIA